MILPGDECHVSVTQGTGLAVSRWNRESWDSSFIPTKYVTYKFGGPKGSWFKPFHDSSLRCSSAEGYLFSAAQAFQEILYGWELLLVKPVNQIYSAHVFSGDECLLGSQMVRIWKERNGDGVKFMAKLYHFDGWRDYLEFDRAFLEPSIPLLSGIG